MGIYDTSSMAVEKDSVVLRIENTKQGITTIKKNYIYLYYQDFQENLEIHMATLIS